MAISSTANFFVGASKTYNKYNKHVENLISKNKTNKNSFHTNAIELTEPSHKGFLGKIVEWISIHILNHNPKYAESITKIKTQIESSAKEITSTIDALEKDIKTINGKINNIKHKGLYSDFLTKLYYYNKNVPNKLTTLEVGYFENLSDKLNNLNLDIKEALIIKLSDMGDKIKDANSNIECGVKNEIKNNAILNSFYSTIQSNENQFKGFINTEARNQDVASILREAYEKFKELTQTDLEKQKTDLENKKVEEFFSLLESNIGIGLPININIQTTLETNNNIIKITFYENNKPLVYLKFHNKFEFFKNNIKKA